MHKIELTHYNALKIALRLSALSDFINHLHDNKDLSDEDAAFMLKIINQILDIFISSIKEED